MTRSAISALAIIGFGEAGQAFARGGTWGDSARVYDVKTDGAARDVKLDDYANAGVTGCASNAEALAGAAIALCVVTADQALSAAQVSASTIKPGALYCDMNSVAPETKREAATAIEAAGGRYVDVAVMSPVEPARLAVPLLLSGPHAAAGEAALATLGFTNIRIVGDAVGRASTIKMLRSVMYKGMEALTAECLIACEKAGVTDEVLGSFGSDWATGADYRMDRMMLHGLRRSAEMYESSQTLLSLGVSPMLTEGTVGWQQAMGELDISPVPEGLKAKLAAILEKMP
jgi:3-hydroxyisobutyrate dehydrogenase-like beta-hydroxyacid dehydrogenase